MANTRESTYNEVFISYSRKNREFAQKIVDTLYEHDIDNIWVDWEDIEFSENWWERIKSGIESAHNFVFLITPDSLKSQPCYDEIEHAVKTGKRIIPVLHMDVVSADDHNQMHPAVAQHHWLNFRETDDFNASMKLLLDTIQTDLPHVRFHTRLLTRAKEWAKEGRDEGRTLATSELNEATHWLRVAERQKKNPYPVNLQREFIASSKHYHRRRQRVIFGFSFISFIIAGLAILSIFLFQDSQRNLALVQQRGTQVAEQAALARNQAILAAEQAQLAAANAVLADDNAGTALAAADSNATQVVIANTAQADAAYNEATAAAALATSRILQATAENDAFEQGQTAIAALSTSEYRGTQVQDEANRAERNADQAEQNAQYAAQNAATAEIARATSEASEELARSQTLALNAEQALELGDTDLAIMLSIEANRIDPDLIQAQNAIYRAADISPYFVVDDAFIASFSPDGSKILTVDNDDYLITIWDVATRAQLHRLEGHLGRINDAVFSHDGQYIISASSDTTIIVWDVESGAEVYRKIASDIAVWDIALHPTEDQFVSVGDFDEEAVAEGLNQRRHNSMILWDLATGDELYRFPRRDVPEMRAEFRYDGQYIFAWSEQMTDWNPRSGRIRNNYGYSYRGFNRDGTIAWTGGRVPGKSLVPHEYDEGDLRLWTTRNNNPRFIRTGFNWNVDEVRALDFSPDGKYIMIAVDRYAQNADGEFVIIDQRLVLLNVADSSIVQTHTEGDIVAVESLYFLKDSQTILSITPDHRLILWDAMTGEILREIGVSNQPMNFIGLSPDENFVMMRTVENDLRIWEITETDRQIVRRLDVEGVQELSFSPDGRQIFAATDAFLSSHNIITRNQNFRIYAGNPIIDMDFHPNAATALVNIEYLGINGGGSNGGLVLQFDMTSQDTVENIETLDYLGHQVCNLNYSDNGRFVMIDGIYQGIALQRQISDIVSADLREELDNQAWKNYCPEAYMTHTMSPNRRYLAVLTSRALGNEIQAGLALYDSSTGILRHELSGFFRLPEAIVFSADSTMLFAAADNVVLVYDVETGDVLRRFIGHSDRVNDIDVSADGRFAISASDDGTVILWDIASGQIVRRYTGHENTVQQVVFNANSTRAASSDGQEIIIWRIEDFDDLLGWLQDNRYIPKLSCVERSQYNIRPLCSEVTPTPTPEPVIAPTATPFQQVEITGLSVNVRNAPNGSVISTLEAGEILIVLDYNLEWFRVVLPDGTDGWINRDYAIWW